MATTHALNQRTAREAPEASVTPAHDINRSLPLLALLMAGSGCAALIYEIVWLQLLQLVIGSSAISLALLLAAYMGGLCLGSAIFSRVISPRHHPLRVYAFLELGIGLLGVLALFGVPLIGRLYLVGATQGMFGLVLRGLVAAVCLLPPTLLMGGSLPALARWVQTTPKGVSSFGTSWVGLLYSANIAGAVFGCLFAGFYLLRIYDMAITTYVAAAINLVVAGLSFAWAARHMHVPVNETPERAAIPVRGVKLIYVAIALSGMGALGAEVVWTRLLGLLLGGTTYTFSIILAVFLVGLWGGSSAGSFLSRRGKDARMALAGCQILLALGIAWTGYTLAHSLPYWPIDPWLSLDPWFNFEIDLVRCVWAVFPAAFLWGASFPLALAAAAGPEVDPGQLAGEVYAANTAGSILGALLFSLIVIPDLGTRNSQQWLIGISVAGAIVALAAVRRIPRAHLAGMAAASIALGIGLMGTISEVPWEMVAYGRRIAPTMRAMDLYKNRPMTVLFRGEGISSSVLIAEGGGSRHFYVSGKAEASTAILDMRLERLMGHLPALINPDPSSVLVVGFGAGVTAGSFVTYPDVKRIVICELEPFIPPASTQYFGKQNYDVMHNPRTQIVYDDARHYIFTTHEKYDVITTDPIHPWIKGTSTLYSKQYYELVKDHLNPGGVVAQWLPIYDTDAETVNIELATFFSVFPNGTVWSNSMNGEGYDLVLLGRQNDNAPINVDDIQQRLDRPDYAPVGASLGDVGIHSAVDFIATYAGRASDLGSMTVNAPINEDLNMRLQYMAGLGLNSMAFPQIYRNLLSYRRFPDGLLTGAAWRMDLLKTLLRPPSTKSR
ncbi:MAG: SAM-dependent methyltransferase [Bryobacteraceae bacterium]|jgi:spermidine synthase